MPLLWRRERELDTRLQGSGLVVFLDYAGMLTPIVEDHTKAVYIGEDLTDEDALRALQRRGSGIVVRGEDDPRDAAAQYALADCGDVRRFLKTLIAFEPGCSS